MNYLLVENISKSYGDKLLFKNITFGINQGNKIALIAKNGAGKTSLLNIISGLDLPDSGQVVFRKEIAWSYLPQSLQLPDNETIFDTIFHTDNKILLAIKNYEQSLELIKKNNSEENQRNLNSATNQIDALNAWEYENKIKEILTRFKILDLSKKNGELSGGQQKKVALAKALLNDAEFLILDEPTNHLDIEMIEWLEEYLSKQNITLLIVTHDRYFLDNICDEILELENGNIYRYKGNYSYYLDKKAERELNLHIEIEKAKSKYLTELEWIKKMPKARTTKSKSRIDSFDSIKEKAFQKIDIKENKLDVKMSRIGGKTIEINNVFKSYDDNCLIHDFSYIFKKGEKVGIIGRNGCGKTTLLNIIMGSLKPDLGRVTTGQTIVFGYYSQEGLKDAEDKRVIEIVKDIAEEIPVGKNYMSASAFLSHFNFNKELQYNYFSNLSGGEKRRLFLLMQLMKNPNFLILDEPTNDLDISTLNILEEFLIDFNGCLLIVSHDRYFMDKIVDHVFVFEGDGKIKDYWGNYSEYYLGKLKEDTLKTKENKNEKLKLKTKNLNKQPERKLSYVQQREFIALEAEIQELEIKKSELISMMNSENIEIIKLNEIATQYEDLEKKLNLKIDRWLELSEYS